MIRFSLRKMFAGILSAAIIAISPGTQAFAQFKAPIRMSQTRLVGLKAPLSAIPSIKPLSPQMQVAQSMSVMAKDLAAPLKAAVAGADPRSSGHEIQDVMEGGRSVKAGESGSAVDAAVSSVSGGRAGLLPATSRTRSAAQGPVAVSSPRAKEPSLVSKIVSALRQAGARAALAAAMTVLGTASPALAGSVNPIYAAISPFKIGFYGPVKDAPVFGWFYLGANVWSQKETAEKKHPIGVEVGVTIEPLKRQMTFLGNRGVEMVYKPTYLAGITYKLNDDIDFSIGGKYGHGKPGGYAGVSFKFSSLYGAQKKIADGTYDTERYIRQYGTSYDLEQYLREKGR